MALVQSPLNVVAGRRDPTDPAPRSGSLSWDDYFMALAFLSAQRSKDPNKQVGAVIVNGSNVILGIGYNGFPRGCCDSDLPWAKVCRGLDGTPDPLGTKYPYVVHAEANALLNKNAASVDGARVYVTMFPCNECAKLLIQAGIREVVYHEAKVQGHDAPLPTTTRAQQQRRAQGQEQGHQQESMGPVANHAANGGAVADTLPAHLRSSQRLQARQRWLQQQEQQQQAEEAEGQEEQVVSLHQRHKRQREEGQGGSDGGSGSNSAHPLTPHGTAAAPVVALSPPPTGASSVASLTSVAAVSGSPGNLASPSPSGLAPAAAGGALAPSPAAAAGEEGKEPWSGFWGGGAVSPAAADGGGRGSSSGQILSSWAKAAGPDERDAPPSADGAAEAEEVQPSATRLRVPLSAAPSDADVCYLASLRMLQLAGVALRQHRLTRGITIPGPADLQA